MDPLDTTLLEKDKKVKSSSRVSGFYFYQCHQLSSELFMLFLLTQKKANFELVSKQMWVLLF